jgi:hypothetical protein
LSHYKDCHIDNNKFIFHTVTPEDVSKILNNTKNSKAPGLDNITGIFLKDGADVLCKPIIQLCNLSIYLSTFPSDCKVAKLKPLYKKGSKTDPKNYRPISLLPLLSKVIERIVHDQMQKFLD